MPRTWNSVVIILLLLYGILLSLTVADEFYSPARKLELREEVRGMFYHAYEGYLKYASGYDELRPLTCDGVDTWGSYSLTLVDALDTLATMGNFSEFRRVAKKLETSLQFDKDINVSVFETNIRIVGGLLSAHLLSKRAGIDVEAGWPCAGPLLRLAEDVAKRLLPAFNTSTGMPYGTVNLRNGVPTGETPVTCTAGVGTLIVEFGTLSRLTGNSLYEKLALNAIYALWSRRSPIGLFGNHIDVQSGRWTAIDAGIGAGVDSFFEYLIKGSILLQQPELLTMFHEARTAINKYLKFDDWYMWANMHKGQVSLPVFQSLDAFWPGSLSMTGDIGSAVRTFAKYNSVWQKYGFLPESYNIPTGDILQNREGYPLRPELAESALYLYRVTKNHIFLETGENILKSIQNSAKTKCGFATIRNVINHERENRMESFFLSETTKYLYLLFDEENFLHNDGQSGQIINTEHGECVVNSGPYIFNTEAHPVDMSALYCCHDLRTNIFEDFNLATQETITKSSQDYLREKLLHEYHPGNDIFVDFEVIDNRNRPADKDVVNKFETVKKQNTKPLVDGKSLLYDLKVIVWRHKRTFNPSTFHLLNELKALLQNYTLHIPLIEGLQMLEKDLEPVLFDVAKKNIKQSMKSLWEWYQLWSMYKANECLFRKLNIANLSNTDERLEEIWLTLTTKHSDAGNSEIRRKVQECYEFYSISLVNITAMQELLLQVLIRQNVHNYNAIDVRLIHDDDIHELYENHKNMSPISEDLEFNLVLEVVNSKIHIKDTMERLNAILLNEESINNNKNQSEESELFGNLNTEIFESINNLKDRKVLSTDSMYNLNSEPHTISTTTSDNNNRTKYTKWLHLVNILFRKTGTTIRKPEFNIAELKMQLERHIERTSRYPAQYEVLTCPSLEFSKLFAYNFYYPD